MNVNNPEAVSVSKWPIIWKFSFIIAGCTFAYTLVLYLTGLYASFGMGLLSLVITIVLLVVCLRKYRSLNNNSMTFGTAAVIGILISIIASAIHSALNAVYLAFIDDSTLIAMTETTMRALEDSGMNGDQIEMIMGLYKNFLFTPIGIFVTGIISGVIGGVIISLILAAILKKDPPLAA